MKNTLIKVVILGALLLSTTAALPIATEKQDGNPFPCPPAPCMPPSAR